MSPVFGDIRIGRLNYHYELGNERYLSIQFYVRGGEIACFRVSQVGHLSESSLITCT